MMICTWGLICFTPIQNSQRFSVLAGKTERFAGALRADLTIKRGAVCVRTVRCAEKMNAKRPTCSVGSFPSKAGTPKNRVWRHTRAKVFHCYVAADLVAHGGAIIPVGTTVSVHGVRPSPFRVVTRYYYIL